MKKDFSHTAFFLLISFVFGLLVWNGTFFALQGEVVPEDVLQSRIMGMSYFREGRQPVLRRTSSHSSSRTSVTSRRIRPEDRTCTDSDGGLAFRVKGEVESNGDVQKDYCLAHTVLQEYFCTDRNTIGFRSEECLGGCRDGRCEPAPNKPKELILRSSPLPEA